MYSKNTKNNNKTTTAYYLLNHFMCNKRCHKMRLCTHKTLGRKIQENLWELYKTTWLNIFTFSLNIIKSLNTQKINLKNTL